jgi:mannose-6-phosphate isomerase-like protein (cupin superfamily)
MNISPHAVVRPEAATTEKPEIPVEGLGVSRILGPDQGAMHLAAATCRLDPGGSIPGHEHPFEESFFILSGRVVVTIADVSYELGEGDFGFAPLGVPHGWANPFSESAGWLRVRAPAPRTDGRTISSRLVDGFMPAASGPTVSATAPHQRWVGHFDDSQVPPPGPIAMPGYRGYGINDVSIRMMVDEFIGAEHHTLFIVQFEPADAFSAKEHFHPYEELYYFTHGAANGLVGGEACEVGAGDLVFAGVNATHGFTNAGNVPVRWVEAQAPKPTPRHGTMFVHDWPAEPSAG